MAPQEVLFWRAFFERLLTACRSREDVAPAFARLAQQPALRTLRAALRSFLQRSVGPWLADRVMDEQRRAELLQRLRAAERALATGGGGA